MWKIWLVFVHEMNLKNPCACFVFEAVHWILMKFDIEGSVLICDIQDLIFVQQIFGNDTNQNFIHSLKFGNAHSYSVQNLLPPCLLSRNVKTKLPSCFVWV
jgi:hypothetical protein